MFANTCISQVEKKNHGRVYFVRVKVRVCLRTCLLGGGGLQVGEVTRFGHVWWVTRLSTKSLILI